MNAKFRKPTQELQLEIMHPNESIITQFYQAFQQRNAAQMNACYADLIIFNDPAFGVMEGKDVRDMWTMLCASAQELQIDFGPIQLLDEEYAQCPWRARYRFRKTNRMVDNHIVAHMRLQDGKIIEHTDQFDLYRWSRMALGWKGFLFGWSNFMQGKIRQQAHQSLATFQARQTATSA